MSLEHSDSAFELRNLGNNCPLCKLLLNVVPRGYSGGYQQIAIIRNDSALKVTRGSPRVILCADLGSSLPFFTNLTISLTTSRWQKDCQQTAVTISKLSHLFCKQSIAPQPAVLYTSNYCANGFEIATKVTIATGENHTGENYTGRRESSLLEVQIPTN